MTKERTPPGARGLYMVGRGWWPKQENVRSVSSLKEGSDWINANHAGRPRGQFHVKRLVVIKLGDGWYRLYVNPLDPKLIPAEWKTPPAAKPPKAPAKFSFKERLQILFTGHPWM